MTNSKLTKKALLTSVMALFLCVAMLTGTTFAWFTDSVTSSGNKIVAGTLDVQLLMDADVDGTYDDISDSTSPIFGEGSIAQNNNAETLWEPGKTQVAYLAIKNNGNLDLKYTVGLNVQNVSKDLYKVMEYAIVPDADANNKVTAWNGGNSVVVGTQSVSGDVELKVGETHYFALAIHMDELAGNEYQGGEVNFDLTVLANQAPVESDSFGKEYDEDATYDVLVADYEVADAVELKQLLGTGIDGAVVRLKAGTYDGVDFAIDYKYDAKNLTLIGEGGTVLTHLNFNGTDTYKNDVDGLTIKNITFTGDLLLGSTEHKNVLVEDCVFNNNARILQGGTGTEESATNVTVKNCKFYGSSVEGSISAILFKVVNGLTVSGCTFTDIDYNAIQLSTEATGNITIENNTISNCGSRAMRIVTKDGAVLNISGNVMTNSDNANSSTVEDRGQVIKISGAVTDGTFANNTHNGVAITFTGGIAK